MSKQAIRGFHAASIKGSFMQAYYLGGVDGEQVFENVTDMITCP